MGVPAGTHCAATRSRRWAQHQPLAALRKVAEEVCPELEQRTAKELPQLLGLLCVVAHLSQAVAAAPAPRGVVACAEGWPPAEWAPGGAVARAAKAAVDRVKERLHDRDPPRIFNPQCAGFLDILADTPLDDAVRGRLGARCIESSQTCRPRPRPSQD